MKPFHRALLVLANIIPTEANTDGASSLSSPSERWQRAAKDYHSLFCSDAAPQKIDVNEFYRTKQRKSPLSGHRLDPSDRIVMVSAGSDLEPLKNAAHPMNLIPKTIREETTQPSHQVESNAATVLPWTDTPVALVLRLLLIAIMWTAIVISQKHR